MPANAARELEAEGIEMLEEQIAGERPLPPLHRRRAAADQPGEQNTILALGLTPKRLALRGTGNFMLDAKPGPVSSEVPEPGKLILRYNAEDLYATRAGAVEIALETPRAEDIHARLQAWNQHIDDLIDRALAEDVGDGDATTEATVDASARARATITQKAPGVISGLDVAAAVFRRLDPDARGRAPRPRGRVARGRRAGAARSRARRGRC